MINAPTELTEHKQASGWRDILPSISKMGFDYVVYCYLNESDGKSYNALTSDNAIGWGKHHLKSRYTKYDPVVNSGQGKKPFIWNTACEDDKNVKLIMNERRDYGMKAGITVPIRKKTGELTAWMSLSCNSNDKYLDSIITAENFYDNALDLHIKSVASTLSNLSGLTEQTAYAITLSDYYRDMDFISEKTGIAVQELCRLYGYLYLSQPFNSLLNVAMSPLDVQPLQLIIPSLNIVTAQKKKLSKRQQECIKALSEGLTSKQGARKMGISPRTYEEYILDVRHIFNCANQKELLSKLYAEGFLT